MAMASMALLFCIVVSGVLACDAFHPPSIVAGRGGASLQMQPSSISGADAGDVKGARVAFLGNSILYYNDSPRFIANLAKGAIAHQDSCFRGGTNLSQLWALGNGMRKHGFATEAARVGESEGSVCEYDVGAPNIKSLLSREEKWDFVVINDHTQGPARLSSREATQNILLEKYLPLILESGATPIIIETAAYRYEGINNSEDLLDTKEFQWRVREGVESYVEVLRSKMPSANAPRIAPVGTAYLKVHDDNPNHALWADLFDPLDHFHPSPCGSFLQGCVIYCTMFGEAPPLPTTDEEIASLWGNARMMHAVGTGEARRLPTAEEVEYLWNVASDLCLASSSRL